MKKNYFLVMLVFAFFSCQKELSHTVASPAEVDVYVAGTEFNGPDGVAVYWKNGNRVILSDGSKDAVASSIFVSGNDVYVCGWEFNGRFVVAKYWKNGSFVTLSDSSIDAWANSIFLAKK